MSVQDDGSGGVGDRIHVRGLQKRYGSLKAVRGLDLDVGAGEIIG